MRGYPRYNFPAFYQAEDFLSALGWECMNPARIDEDNGFNPDGPVEPHMMPVFIRRDFECIMAADAICLLEGWGRSVGATAEVFIAFWKGIPVYEYPIMKELDRATVLARLAALQLQPATT